MHMVKSCIINCNLFLFQDFYDLDIIDEEVLIEWGGHPSKKYVPKDLSKLIHEKAAPVIKWLQEADEESSEEEEDEVPLLVVLLIYESIINLNVYSYTVLMRVKWLKWVGK